MQHATAPIAAQSATTGDPWVEKSHAPRRSTSLKWALPAYEEWWSPQFSVQWKPFSYRQRTALVRLQGNLLGKHDVSRDQIADRHETPTQVETARMVHLVNVHR
jgi:hypothetical protein